MWSENLKGHEPNSIPTAEWNPTKEAFPFFSDYEQDDKNRFIAFAPEGMSVVLQRGAVKELGVNGAQIDDVLTVCLSFLRGVNTKVPCRENSVAITKLEECLMWLGARTADRERRGVEGESER